MIFSFYTYFRRFFHIFLLDLFVCKFALVSFYTYFHGILTILQISFVFQTPPQTPPAPPRPSKTCWHTILCLRKSKQSVKHHQSIYEKQNPISLSNQSRRELCTTCMFHHARKMRVLYQLYVSPLVDHPTPTKKPTNRIDVLNKTMENRNI